MKSMLSEMWEKWMRNWANVKHKGTLSGKDIPALFAQKRMNIDLIIIVIIKERSSLTCFDFNFPTAISDIRHAAFLHMYVCFQCTQSCYVWENWVCMDICECLCWYICLIVFNSLLACRYLTALVVTDNSPLIWPSGWLLLLGSIISTGNYWSQP